MAVIVKILLPDDPTTRPGFQFHRGRPHHSRQVDCPFAPLRSPWCLALAAKLTFLVVTTAMPFSGAAQAKSVKLVKTFRVPWDLHTSAFPQLLPNRFVQVGTYQWKAAEPPYRSPSVPVLDIDKRVVVMVKPPLVAFIKAHHKIFLRGTPFRRSRKGRKLLKVKGELVYYDPARGRGGVLIRDHLYRARLTRVFYVSWDTRKNLLEHPIKLADHPRSDRVTKIGADAEGKAFYFYIHRKRADTGTRPITVARVNLQRGKIDWKVDFTAPLRKHGLANGWRIVTSPDRKLLAFLEYSEASFKQAPAASAYLIDVAARKHTTFPILATPYGLSFAPDRKSLVIASAQVGRMVRVDLQTGKVSKAVRIARMVHRLTFSRDGKRLYLVHSSTGAKSIQVHGWPSLKRLRRKAIPAHKVLPGEKAFSPDGSVITDNGRYMVIEKAGASSSNSENVFHLLEFDP